MHSAYHRIYCCIFVQGLTAACVRNDEGFSFEQCSSPGSQNVMADNGELAEGSSDGFAKGRRRLPRVR